MNRWEHVAKLLAMLGLSYDENVGRLTDACGEVLGAYGAALIDLREEKPLLQAAWPHDFAWEVTPDGLVKDTLDGEAGLVHVVAGLAGSRYAEIDPNVARHELDMYAGQAVRSEGKAVGVLLAAYRSSRGWTADDAAVLGVLAASIGAEESRRRARSVLEKRAERYELIASNTGDVIWVMDLTEHRFTYVSPSVERLRGYTVQEVLAQPMAAVMTPESAAGVQRAISERVVAVEGGQVKSYRDEVEQTRRDGTTVWTETTTRYMRNAQTGHIEVFGVSRDITERRKAERSLALSEQRLRRAQEHAGLGSWTWSIKTDTLEWSDQMYRIFGVDKATFSGSLADVVSHAIHPDDRAAVEASNLAAAREGRPYPLEYRVVWPDGTERTVWSDAAELVKGPDGEPETLSGIIKDITDSKRLEQELREGKEYYATLFGHSPLPAALVRVKDMLLVDVNEEFASYFRGSRDGLIGTRADGLGLSAEPGPDASQRLLLHDGQIRNLEVRLTAGTGETRRGLLFVDRIDRAAEKLLLVQIVDITELKRSEESAADLGWILDASLNEIFVFDATTLKFLRVNQGARSNLRYTMDELKEMTPVDIKPEYTLESFEQAIAPLREGKLSTLTFDTIHGRKDGSTYPVSVRLHMSKLEGREVFVAIIADTTVERAAKAEQDVLHAQLQQAMKMEAIGRLAGGIAHDFNNLLTSITGNISLALMDLDDKDPLAELLREASQSADSAASLTRQLLAFSRKQMIEPKVLNLNDLVSNLRKMLGRIIGEDVVLETRLRPALPSVRVDPGQFEQVLVNLVVNARDAMPSGGTLTIETGESILATIRTTRLLRLVPGKYVTLTVSDTGEGMSTEVMDHLFEPFFTTKPKGRGTGLGLATIFGAVKQAGGAIEVHSAPGSGSTFLIYLPSVDDVADKLTEVRRPVELPSGGETILIVEDDPAVRGLALRILKRLGYAVLEASNAGEALLLVERHTGPIDLLLTDVVMPEMNGRDLAQRLSQDRPALRVLFTSGYTDDIIASHGVLEENLDFIAKPYAPQALAAKVRSVLDASPR